MPKNYFEFVNRTTGEIKKAWCRSRNSFHFCVQRGMMPSEWKLVKSIIWDRELLKKMLDK